MAKKLLSITLALLMVFTSAALLPAFAAGELIGDVDQDGDITSADARLALRGSVKLETLTADFLNRADVDGNGQVESSDARTILRTSVRLDNITQADHEHKVEKWEAVTQDGGASADCHCGVCTKCGRTIFGGHDFEVKVTKEYTCTEDGSGIETCMFCGLQGDTVEIPAAHEWVPVEGSEKPATCTENGSCEYRCSRCNETKTEVLPAGHKVTDDASCTEPQKCIVCGEIFAPALGHIYPEGAAITVTKGIRCLRCGKVGLPSFNDLVNVLKDGTHTYTSVIISNSTSESPKLDGIMEPLINMMQALAKKSGEEIDIMSMLKDLKYSDAENDFIQNAVLLDRSFPLYRQNVVSALKDSDVTSIQSEIVNGVDFLSSLPDSLAIGSSNGQNPSTKTVDLTKLKGTTTGPVRKVTVKLAPEQFTKIAANGGDRPISRVDNSLSEMSAVEEFGLESFGMSSEELDNIPIFGPVLKASEIITDSVSDITVTYYFDEITNAPIAAFYDETLVLQFKFNTYVDDITLEKTDKITGSVEFAVQTDMDYYYFFDGNFVD